MITGFSLASGGWGNDFVFTMATTGAAETVTIPCQDAGTFNAVIDWGDGSGTSTITTFNDADLAHEYASAGDHEIKISGTFPNIYFNNTGDKLKLKSVEQLGVVGWITLNRAFFGCSNMTAFAGGNVNTSAVTNMSFALRGCSSLTSIDLSGFNTSAVTDMSQMFNTCSGLTSLDVSSFDTASVTDMNAMFYDCNSVTSLDLSNFDTSLVANMSEMFRLCNSLTDVVGVDAFDIEGLNGTSDLNNFMTHNTLPTSRYDALLIAWDAQNPFDGMAPNFGGSKYTGGGAAATARANLISTDGWTITDGGIA